MTRGTKQEKKSPTEVKLLEKEEEKRKKKRGKESDKDGGAETEKRKRKREKRESKKGLERMNEKLFFFLPFSSVPLQICNDTIHML